MSSKSTNVEDLFKNAAAEGMLSPQSIQVLTRDMGKRIQAGLGVSVDDVQATAVVLATLLIDDSGSIRFAGNASHVRSGHNGMYQALRDSKQHDGILGHTRYLNGTILFPYSHLDQVVEMDTNNYNPNGGTPLYDETIVTLGTVMAKIQECSDNGLPARSVTYIISDGHDEGSRKTESQVFPLVRDMLKKSENNIIGAMGIDDGRTDFFEVFTGWTKDEVEAARQANELDQLDAKGGMGIQPKWVLTPANSASEIRKAFLVVSQSAVRASQNRGSFSKQALGGFGNP